MLKTLKKNSRRKILLKLRLKDFIIKQLWQYAIILASLALCAWIFDRWLEAVMLCISHTCIRNAFNKQFHFNKTAYCLLLTLAIIWFATPIVLPLGTSLLSSIPIAFLISFFGFIAQDRVDLILKTKHKSIYSMSSEELYEHCRKCGLSDEDSRIAYFVVYERLKGKELYDAIGYSERHAKRKRSQILKTIK